MERRKSSELGNPHHPHIGDGEEPAGGQQRTAVRRLAVGGLGAGALGVQVAAVGPAAAVGTEPDWDVMSFTMSEEPLADTTFELNEGAFLTPVVDVPAADLFLDAEPLDLAGPVAPQVATDSGLPEFQLSSPFPDHVETAPIDAPELSWPPPSPPVPTPARELSPPSEHPVPEQPTVPEQPAVTEHRAPESASAPEDSSQDRSKGLLMAQARQVEGRQDDRPAPGHEVFRPDGSEDVGGVTIQTLEQEMAVFGHVEQQQLLQRWQQGWGPATEAFGDTLANVDQWLSNIRQANALNLQRWTNDMEARGLTQAAQRIALDRLQAEYADRLARGAADLGFTSMELTRIYEQAEARAMLFDSLDHRVAQSQRTLVEDRASEERGLERDVANRMDNASDELSYQRYAELWVNLGDADRVVVQDYYEGLRRDGVSAAQQLVDRRVQAVEQQYRQELEQWRNGNTRALDEYFSPSRQTMSMAIVRDVAIKSAQIPADDARLLNWVLWRTQSLPPAIRLTILEDAFGEEIIRGIRSLPANMR